MPRFKKPRGCAEGMPTSQIAQVFDAISPRYDATRDPLDSDTLAALHSRLREAGVDSLLEVGVGTGRVAAPLTDRGMAVAGVDVSLGMLQRARCKGLDRLLRGSAYHLPFTDGAFDAALFVHVLHVLEDPSLGLREATRVGRRGAYALVHPRNGSAREAPERDRARQLIFDELERQGFAVPDRKSPMEREREFLFRHPPDHLAILSEREVTEPVARRLEVFSARAHRWSLRVPPEVLEQVLRSARRQLGDREITYHRTEALALWSRA